MSFLKLIKLGFVKRVRGTQPMAGVPREGVSNHLSLPGGPYNSTEGRKEISYSSY